MRNRAYRREMKVKHKHRLMEIVTRNRANQRAGYIECIWEKGVNKVVGKYIKYPKNSNLQKYLKRQSRRLIRRTSETFSNGNSYRKCMEYKWHFV